VHQGCQSLVKRRSPTQRSCDDCRTVDRRERARLGMRRLRGRRWRARQHPGPSRSPAGVVADAKATKGTVVTPGWR